MPIRARIALFGAGVVAVTVVIFGIVVYVLAERNLVALQDEVLNRRARQVMTIPQLGRLLVSQRYVVPSDLRTGSDTFVEFLEGNGTPIVSTGEIDGAAPLLPADILRAAGTQGGVQATIEPQPGVKLRVIVRQLNRSDIGPGGYVVVGQPMRVIEGQLTGLRLFLTIGALLSLLGALAASWLLAGRALRPLESMAQTVEKIGETQDLTRRLSELRTRDEVQRLTKSFNGMLQRLQNAYSRMEEALAAQRRFVADASHELRTPLTSIRSNVGLVLQRPDIQLEDQQGALQDIAGESERMSRLVSELLTLARADAGQHLDRVPLDLLPIVQDVSRQAQKLHPSRELQLEDGLPAAQVIGNADALKQLLWILLDNAVRHTQDGGQIWLRVDDSQGGRVELSVADDGTGFPEADLERIFERFYRADPARSGDGTGLGLAIARWIVYEHEGQVSARNNPVRGATFRVDLPVIKS